MYTRIVLTALSRCIARFLKASELRNAFDASLIVVCPFYSQGDETDFGSVDLMKTKPMPQS